MQPADPETKGRFDVMPADVAEEMRQFLASDLAGEARPDNGHTHLLISRRMNTVMNTVGSNLGGTLRRDPTNPAYMHPEEFTSLGVQPGDRLVIASDHGRIEAVAQPDKTLRPGVVSMAHCWGGLPDEPGPGVNTNLLIACDKDVEAVNAMPRMSAVPVHVSKAG